MSIVRFFSTSLKNIYNNRNPSFYDLYHLDCPVGGKNLSPYTGRIDFLNVARGTHAYAKQGKTFHCGCTLLSPPSSGRYLIKGELNLI